MAKYTGVERRRYVRLSSVFPVEFQFASQEGLPVTPIQQGFTNDISEGGLCLIANCLDIDFAHKHLYRDSKLLLNINVPLSLKSIKAKAKIAWFKKEEKHSARFKIGVAYEEIDKADQQRIIWHARLLHYTPRVAVIMFALALTALSFVFVNNLALRQSNERLAEKLVSSISQSKDLKIQLDNINTAKEQLTEKVAQSGARVAAMEADLDKIRSAYSKFTGKKIEPSKEIEFKELEDLKIQKDRLEIALRQAVKEKQELVDKISQITKEQQSVKTKMEDVARIKTELDEATARKMYEWLKVHQNKNTGLISSYEGDSDLKECAFTYDQALVAMAFTLFNDFEAARRILDFYKDKARAQNGVYSNAYDTFTGKMREDTRHAGPNTWLAIAALKYVEAAKDDSYMSIVDNIATWLLGLQAGDKQGAIKGGEEFDWVSTEHNLDAYALFTMLYKHTKDSKYEAAAGKILKWLKENAYSPTEYRIYRGRGDSTIATDTFAWAIASVGPAALFENGMDADEILKFAEDNCEVKAKFKRPGAGTVEVTGFDFAKAAHLARGGIVSSEWTAQMIVSFKVMADYYAKNKDSAKAKYYADKTTFYINELEKLLIASPSWSGQGQWCLPYATASAVDTGHGWRTPKGNSTGSVSGTTYTIFAKEGFNPLGTED